jgi:hypothetical protein
MLTYSLNKQVRLFGLIALGKFDRRYFYLKATRLPACQTLEVYVVVMMIGLAASIVTKSIFKTSFIIKNLMDKTLVKEGLKCPINGYTVQRTADGVFNVTMRKGVLLLDEKVEDFLPCRGGP